MLREIEKRFNDHVLDKNETRAQHGDRSLGVPTSHRTGGEDSTWKLPSEAQRQFVLCIVR